MAKRRRERGSSQGPTDWESERTLADAEADAAAAAELSATQPGGDPDETIDGVKPVDAGLPFFDAEETDPGRPPTPRLTPASLRRVPEAAAAPRCACGGEEFVVEAYLAVIRGQPQREPLELESLTCPQCAREYEAVWLEDGRIVRGEFRGFAELDE